MTTVATLPYQRHRLNIPEDIAHFRYADAAQQYATNSPDKVSVCATLRGHSRRVMPRPLHNRTDHDQPLRAPKPFIK